MDVCGDGIVPSIGRTNLLGSSSGFTGEDGSVQNLPSVDITPFTTCKLSFEVQFDAEPRLGDCPGMEGDEGEGDSPSTMLCELSESTLGSRSAAAGKHRETLPSAYSDERESLNDPREFSKDLSFT
jgi:hypothetical protein